MPFSNAVKTTDERSDMHISYIGQQPFDMRWDANQLFFHDSNDNTPVNWQPETCTLTAGTSIQTDQLLAALDAVYNRETTTSGIQLNIAQPQLDDLAEYGFVEQKNDCAYVAADLFWQCNALWLTHPVAAIPQRQVMDANGKRHPLRRPKNTGVVYQRYIPWLGQTLSFRTVDIEQDLPAFNRWMNDERVAHFWEEQGSIEQHRQFLQTLAQDPHTQTVIGCFDDIPFGYFELYWAKEDRIAPFYDAADYDRGWHLLVGEDNYRGREWFSAWFPSLQHLLFLDDVRTQRILAEPRQDNARLIGHAQKLGFANLKTFDFPHKRAQLLMLCREQFFNEHRWQPLTVDQNL